jgi:hypothetical protein
VLLANLHNHTQPLIHYELTDRVIRHPAVGDPYLSAAVEGAPTRYSATEPATIDPLVIRAVVVKTPGVIEYQVRQTDHGIDAAVVADGALRGRRKWPAGQRPFILAASPRKRRPEPGPARPGGAGRDERVPGGQEVVGQRLAAAAATGAGRSGPPGLGGDLPRRAAGRAC